MNRLFIYVHPFLFILSWWCLAFSGHSASPKSCITPKSKQPFNSEVTPINRQHLLRALNGDFGLMSSLIVEWDLEAQLLEEKGYKGIRRLDRRQILAMLRQEAPAKAPCDQRYFPQTYLAAGILLALVDGSTLTSLPRGLRHLDHLYLSDKLQSIPADSDPRFLEAIGSSEDTIAFISPYSEPCTLRAVEQRGISMVDLGCVNSPHDLQSAIATVGQIAHTPEKATLLNTFIDATLIAIENHLATRPQVNGEVLYVNHHTVFSAPTRKTLTGNLLNRLNINRPFFDNQPDDWSLPLEIEDIAVINPDCIICAGTNTFPLDKLRDVKAAQNGQIHFVDRSTQETQSQHFLLGYYDLYDILMRLP